MRARRFLVRRARRPESETTLSDAGKGRGRNKTAFVALNTAVVEATPSAIVATIASDASGLRRLSRKAYRTSASAYPSVACSGRGLLADPDCQRRRASGARDRSASRRYHAFAAVTPW